MSLSSGILHAICPVASYKPDAWKGWAIVRTERVEHTADVAAYGANRHTRTFSTGNGWDVYHLARRAA